MSSHSKPRTEARKADGAITQFAFVKYGTDRDHVALATSATDKIVGIAKTSASNAEDLLEIYLPGGGGKLKLNETVVGGDSLTATAAGLGEVADANNEKVGAVAYDDGVANDVIGVEVMLFTHGQ